MVKWFTTNFIRMLTLSRLNSTVFIEIYNALGKAFCTREGFGCCWISNKHIIYLGKTTQGILYYYVYTFKLSILFNARSIELQAKSLIALNQSLISEDLAIPYADSFSM